jgi:galactoside O-acetyltransferase
VGEYSVIDDFSYFSTKVRVGKCSHLASGCSIAGGKEWQFTLGDYSSLSSGVKVWCASDDFANDIVTIIPPQVFEIIGEVKNNFITGDVRIGNFTAVGANTVIMPANDIPEGVVIGALSFVTPNYKFKPWSVYAGIPLRFIKKRNRKNVLRQVKLIEKCLENKL